MSCSEPSLLNEAAMMGSTCLALGGPGLALVAALISLSYLCVRGCRGGRVQHVCASGRRTGVKDTHDDMMLRPEEKEDWKV